MTPCPLPSGSPARNPFPLRMGSALVSSALLTIALCAAPLAATAREAGQPTGALPPPNRAPARLDREAAASASSRALAWLVANQRPSGAWAASIPGFSDEASYSVETHHSWRTASCALATLALLRAQERPARTRALLKGLRWLATARRPRRGNHWDTDHLWPALLGTVALAAASDDKRVRDDPSLAKSIDRRAREYLDVLVRNQDPLGGWAYYDRPPWSRRNKWATSFCTALVLPALRQAHRRGWLADARVVDRAIRYVERCRLPGGAYAYSLSPIPWISGGEHINRVKGSLSRIQVCHWALATIGSQQTTPARIRKGLEQFFEHHKWLDIARLRPNPHEAYYANSGYFYMFGHYYAALVIQHLPESEREAHYARLRPHVIKTLRADGHTSDFLDAAYMRVASTAYAALTLEATK